MNNINILLYCWDEADLADVQDLELCLKKIEPITTDYAVTCISEYMDNPLADPAISSAFRNVFGKQMQRKAFLVKQETYDYIQILRNLKYEDVFFYMDDAVIEESMKAFKYFEDNADLVMAQVIPVLGSQYKMIVNDFKEYLKVNPSARPIYNGITKMQSFFKDSVPEVKNTRLAYLERNKDKIEVLQRGLKFVKDKKAEGADPLTWRLL